MGRFLCTVATFGGGENIILFKIKLLKLCHAMKFLLTFQIQEEKIFFGERSFFTGFILKMGDLLDVFVLCALQTPLGSDENYLIWTLKFSSTQSMYSP